MINTESNINSKDKLKIVATITLMFILLSGILIFGSLQSTKKAQNQTQQDSSVDRP
jgi:membrane protein involved in colicin uptake